MQLSTDFLLRFGYAQGCKSEATHYSTFGTNDVVVYKFLNGKLYYFDEMASMWKESFIDSSKITLLGDIEPNFRCGPQNQVIKSKYHGPFERQSDIYSKSKYKGD